MVAHLIRLRFLILGNSFRRSTWQIVATVLAAIYGLGVLGLAVAGLFALSFTTVEITRTVIVLGGSVLVLGWMVLPLVASGVDQTVDPARLAPFPIPLNTLLLGLTVSGVLGVAGIVTSIAALATALSWLRHPLAALAAVICAVVGVLICVVGSRAIAALATGVGSGRRFREAKGILLFIPLILLGPIFFGVMSLVRNTSAAWPTIADVLGWTPLGAIWAVPGDVASGDYGRAGLEFLIGLATLALLAVIWKQALGTALESPARVSEVKTTHRGIGLFGVLPGTPTGAVAARALTYWIRDPRYAQSLITIPLIPVLFAFWSATSGNHGIINAIGPICAILLSLSIFTDVSYDNTAFALHLQTGVTGRADRLGRVIALAAFSVPVTLVFTVGSVWFTGDWQLLPGLLALSCGALLVGFAVSSVISGRFAFMVPAPGESPFKSKPGGGMTLMLSMLATWSMVVVLMLPEIVLAVIGWVTGQAIYGWLALIVSVVLGTLLLIIGVRWGGAVLDRRGPELLAQLQMQK